MSKPIMDLAAAAKQAVPAITPEEVKPLLDRDDVLIVDVRDDNEVAESGKVKGAVHVSRGMLDFPPTRPRPFTTWRSPRTRRSLSIAHQAGGPPWAARRFSISAMAMFAISVPSRTGSR